MVDDVDDDRRRDSIDCRLKFNVDAQTLDGGIDPDVVIIDCIQIESKLVG